jgi:predicted nuclease of restriction endonuclease-like (RecB) superfamily
MNYSSLIKSITGATHRLQEHVATVANQALVIRNWLVGAWLVEFEQNGKDRAKYGQKLLESVAADLAKKQIKGLTDPRVLRDCRVLYRVYPQIRGSVTRELGTIALPPVTGETAAPGGKRIRGSATRELPPSLVLEDLMRLSWTHLQELIRLDDPWSRAFYENECLKGRWSIRQLQRQIGSLLYERTGLSTDKRAVIQRARTQEPRQSISDVLRDPYVLEFTGLSERTEYSELDLETVLLDHLQKFLLELGRGFCFEARQFRITEGRKHHRIDLVFYHRLLRCHVLIDLKIRPFKPADAGQMNFYVNWFKANMMEDDDQPPVGILLCSDSDGTEVEFATAGMDQKLFVSRYLVALPSVEKLRRFLEADRERIESQMPPPKARKRGPRQPKTGPS